MTDNSMILKLVIANHELTVKTIRNFTQESDKITSELKESGREDLKFDRSPYYGIIWDSARTLAEIIASTAPDRLAGKTYLEVGCGLAIPSMIAAKMGAKAIASDFHPDCRKYVEDNAAMNGLHGSKNFSYVEANWHDLKEIASKADYVIGSDILYDKSKAYTLGDFIGDAFKAGIKEAIIVDAGRPYIGAFKDRCASHGLSVSETKYDVDVRGKPVNTVVMVISKP